MAELVAGIMVITLLMQQLEVQVAAEAVAIQRLVLPLPQDKETEADLLGLLQAEVAEAPEQ